MTKSAGGSWCATILKTKDAERLGLPYGVRNLEDETMVEFYIRLPLAADKEEQE